MPELPEVETTKNGIKPHLEGAIIESVIVRQPQLRWPITKTLETDLHHQTIERVYRRAKYILIACHSGTLLIHLGMSGSLRIITEKTPLAAKKHDHVEIILQQGQRLRYNDPRRFGAIIWTTQPVSQHPLLSQLGPEPLSEAFNGEYLRQYCANRTTTIKNIIMNGKVVVGVGNIYANESLFLANISPHRQANRLSTQQYELLCQQIKHVLKKAIAAGGTTLQDFTNSDGKPGYFSQYLHVYGKAGHPCPKCTTLIVGSKITQRATYHCPACQA